MPKVTFMNEQVTVEAQPGQTLLEIAEKNGIEVFRGIWPDLHCNRVKGWCNRCKVWATPLEEKALSERTSSEKSKLRINGAVPAKGTMRLACQVKVNGDCEVRTRSDGPARQHVEVWAVDPRPSKWQERWAKAKAGEGGGEEEEAEAEAE